MNVNLTDMNFIYLPVHQKEKLKNTNCRRYLAISYDERITTSIYSSLPCVGRGHQGLLTKHLPQMEEQYSKLLSG
jgi:hypothetical protein